MRILIVEDELPAQERLKNLLAQVYPAARVVGVLASVAQTAEYLASRSDEVDMVLMDVALADGLCFEVFAQVEVKPAVVITTAYDQYALHAFKVGSIDYLLKPIEGAELKKSLDRAAALIGTKTDPKRYLELMEFFSEKRGQIEPPTKVKERFLIRIGDKIKVVHAEQIAYFYAENKLTYLATKDGRRYILDTTLDKIEESVCRRTFFRLSRGCIASLGSIGAVAKHFAGRLRVELTPAWEQGDSLMVSRQRVPLFLGWLEGEVDP